MRSDALGHYYDAERDEEHGRADDGRAQCESGDSSVYVQYLVAQVARPDRVGVKQDEQNWRSGGRGWEQRGMVSSSSAVVFV